MRRFTSHASRSTEISNIDRSSIVGLISCASSRSMGRPGRDGFFRKGNRRNMPWQPLAHSQRARRHTIMGDDIEATGQEKLMGIRITGVGAYVPNQQVTNDDLARRVDTSGEWISARTGILERRV